MATSVAHEHDRTDAEFDDAPEGPLTDEELAAFKEAMAEPGRPISSEELLERVRPTKRPSRPSGDAG